MKILMKQKICNRILSIYNSLVWVVFLIFGICGFNFEFGLKYSFSASPFMTDYKNVIGLFNTIFICLIVINIFFLIQNRKNKKMIYWYIIPILHYLIFQIELPDFFSSTAWAIIPLIVLVINFINKIAHEKKESTIVLQVLGIIMCVVMFFVNKYNSTIWLLISSVMLFIYSKDSIDNSKSIKIINTIITIAINIMLIIGIVKYIILISNMHKIDDETENFVSQIKSGLAKEKTNNNTLIPVCKNNKWGYINTKGEEILPCEYDAVSPEFVNLSKVNYDIFMLKKENEYYIVSKSGKILATLTGTPVPWYAGDMKENTERFHSGYDESEKYQDILMSARKIIAQYIEEKKEEVDTTETNIIEPDDDDGWSEDNNMLYVFRMENGYILEFEEIVDYEVAKSDFWADSDIYNLKLKKDGKIIESIDNIDVPRINKIETYTNGDIPFYSFEDNIQGYYSRENHKYIWIKI